MKRMVSRVFCARQQLRFLVIQTFPVQKTAMCRAPLSSAASSSSAIPLLLLHCGTLFNIDYDNIIICILSLSLSTLIL